MAGVKRAENIRQMLKVKLKPGIIIKEVGGSHILKYQNGVKSSYFKVSGDYLNLISELQHGVDIHEILNQEANWNKAYVINFVSALADLNLLDDQEAIGIRKVPNLAGKMKIFLFFVLRIKVFQFDPDRLLTWIYTHLKLSFLYRLSFLVPAFIFSLVMFVLLAAEGFFSFSTDKPEQKIVYYFLYYIFFALGILIHELAHSMTCKHWGGEVKSLGFLLYYFLPAGFSDVSDSYLFDKFKRISVLLAGPLTTIFIGLWLGAIWLVTVKGSFIKNIAYSLALVSIVAPLFSLNPLLRFDGYYLLTEFFGIENLRRRSFNYLKTSIKSVLPYRKKASTLPRIPRKEKIIYLVYGIISGLYSLSFLFFSIYKLICLL